MRSAYKKLTCFLILWLVVPLALVRGDAATNDAQHISQPMDTGRVLLDYSQFLRDETARHQAFLEGVYDKLVKVLAGIVVVFGAVLTWLNWKTKKEIREQVNTRIDSMAKSAIDLKLKAFDDQLQLVRGNLDSEVKALRDSLEEQSREINRVIFAPEHRGRFMAEPRPVGSGRGKGVLWVDDHPENNDTPAQILRSNGVEITFALSTEEALEALKKHPFDLIISDMGRGPNPSAGLDLLRAIRQQGITTPVIIFCSSKAVARFGAEARRLGALAVTSGSTTLLDSALAALKLCEDSK
jgi:CheY-like chemotaxis protein